MLPHKFSEYGPALAAGDVDGDGLQDIVVGGNSTEGAMILLQQPSGLFIKKPLPQPVNNSSYQQIDMGISLFDADGDGDPDIYIAGGGYEAPENSELYKDKFYINDGKGNFAIDSTALPQNYTSKSCVRVVITITMATWICL